ncbi:hypothetical protein Lal_00045140 [Lupinus albus]|nr:hypothetical protein Lal_00045140 [Lupinus albus]
MATEIRVPTLGESVSEATVGTWFKKVGDTVKADEPIVELETDKVTVEVPAPAAGVLTEIVAQAGETVGLGALLGQIAEGAAGSASAAAPAAAAPAAAPALQHLFWLLLLQCRRLRLLPSLLQTTISTRLTLTVPASVVSRAGCSPCSVHHGRCRSRRAREDDAPAPDDRQAPEGRPEHGCHADHLQRGGHEGRDGPAQQVQGRVREEAWREARLHGFFTKAVTHALKELPAVNAEIDGTDIIYKNYCHVGMAVGTDKGLVVPVIRDADQLSIAGVEKELGRLAKAARDGSLGMADMQGGTFTITNGGVYGSLMSSPILNAPQSGILACTRSRIARRDLPGSRQGKPGRSGTSGSRSLIIYEGGRDGPDGRTGWALHSGAGTFGRLSRPPHHAAGLSRNARAWFSGDRWLAVASLPRRLPAALFGGHSLYPLTGVARFAGWHWPYDHWIVRMMHQYVVELVSLMAIFAFAIVSPGADLAMVMRQSFVHGRRQAIITSVGIGSALMFHVSYTILGIGLIISQSILPFQYREMVRRRVPYLYRHKVLTRRQKDISVQAVSAADEERKQSGLKAYMLVLRRMRSIRSRSSFSYRSSQPLSARIRRCWSSLVMALSWQLPDCVVHRSEHLHDDAAHAGSIFEGQPVDRSRKWLGVYRTGLEACH